MDTKTKSNSKSKIKSKVYHYYTGAKFNFDGHKQSIVTQLYQIGVYAIWNNDSARQGGYSPNQLQTLFRKIKKDFKSGKITDLVLGRPIAITTDVNGFYIEKE